ncbi:MAG: FAD-dependent oxidoreductase [Clostridia bacterium]|nr:FAD-dependent oxidoreductase [Clostridia bacterium]
MQMTFDTPVARKVDVLVIGGGCAGLAAAVSAARHGAKVLIADANNSLGGMATTGLVGPFMTCYDPQASRQVIKGIFDETVRRMIKKGGAIAPENVQAGTSLTAWRVKGHDNCTPFSAEAFKLVADEMCQEAGVEVLYHAMFLDAHMNDAGDRIEGAVFATKSGLLEIQAEQFIDCTGDGDVAYRSGVPCVYGDEEGNTQPSSLFFIIDNVDKARLEALCAEKGPSALWFQADVEREIEEGRYSVQRNKVALYENPDGTFRVNMSRVTMKDGCDPFQYSAATIKARAQVEEIMGLLRRLVPGCENIRLVTTASMLGHRETRRIQGDFVLTGEDILAKTKFDDVIFMAGSSMDMHGGRAVNYTPAQGEAYSVPYRILLPRKVNNLLVAGRSCSLDRRALAAIRVMPPVFAMGQAAGTAAALCVENKVAPKDVCVKQLQEKLVADNVVLA